MVAQRSSCFKLVGKVMGWVCIIIRYDMGGVDLHCTWLLIYSKLVQTMVVIPNTHCKLIIFVMM